MERLTDSSIYNRAMSQSVAASSRQSYLPHSATNAAAAAKLLEKKKEFEAVAALEQASTQFLKRIEELGDDFDIMADAGRVHGQVLEQWPYMFKILHLFLSTREQHSNSAEIPIAPSQGERLIRVPVEELRPSEEKS
ncbi:uncharacterized protein FIBRA_00352 [Fibroporia radiculosa]|uniref:DASH complex subunit DAD2 n=1 Tax=Fibroporia radiculosa TaxID=599839 RepID=J7RGZ0_9APHY|nr:uncharacterized protein FIBRA_00352 [Fibroporia radiculosa]CCL98357.1 predicted protein [Fibroporia radiculosa]